MQTIYNLGMEQNELKIIAIILSWQDLENG